MSSQRLFESDEAYASRIAQEANARTIQESTGSRPSQGWSESDESYRQRIELEAYEHRIKDSTGSRPSQGWSESKESYRQRIELEANARTIQDLTRSAPSRGRFESDDAYATRIRREANKQIVARGTGSTPKQSLFEGNYDYRRRIAVEANQVRASRGGASGGQDTNCASDDALGSSSSTDYAGTSSESSSGIGGVLVSLLILGGVAVVGVFAFIRSSSSLPAARVTQIHRKPAEAIHPSQSLSKPLKARRPTNPEAPAHLSDVPTAPGVNRLTQPLTGEVPAMALLEIFTLANDSSGRWSPRPAIRTYWKGDLQCSDTFLLPDRVSEVGLGSLYWAAFSFHFEAQQPGTYEFTVEHNRMNDCFLRYLGRDLVKSEGRRTGFLGSPSRITSQGRCQLEKGPNRFEFWLQSHAEEPGRNRGSAVFQVKVLIPGASNAVPITADMIKP